MIGWLTLILPAFFSCSKTDTANPTGSNVRVQVLNLSPDLFPIEFWINNGSNYIRLNSSYRYAATPSYFYLTYNNPLPQIRSTRVADTRRILYRDSSEYKANTRHTIFFMGLYADSTYKFLKLTDDTEPVAPIGKGGKIRFVNGSPRSTPFDIWANGTVAIKNVAFGTASDYQILPPGSYSFKAYPTGSTTSSLTTLQNVTIQDGRLYTLYSSGMVGRVDSAAFGLNLLAIDPSVVK
ncbi:DUF4397 domain-containing protein [Mucilaginibacter daejeonensis]|uniref:DUF4397 domain-containing protein n=1 Tax=Mucilaginibacter daejeonensis TaxID=398049 RepID=UPI001D178C2E|nr:DUF4397 domain-containing protein [Mucilaginibacter daejeonensis]UEG54216.1 DUF4397 domain-containing protein [Mucilaginibacter daejeonensis]